jgi:F-type H+-transporting ATPase subunit delta
MKATKHARHEATQLFRLCQVNGVLDETRAREAVRQIVATKPRGYLGTLLYLQRLVRLDAAERTARVESAAKLPSDVQAGVQAGLTRAYGAGLSTTFAENPALIGGMRIRVGSDVYDGSVQGRLAALEQSF